MIVEEMLENSNKNFILTVKNLNIEFNKITFVIGRVGCGKSALLSAI